MVVLCDIDNSNKMEIDIVYREVIAFYMTLKCVCVLCDPGGVSFVSGEVPAS